MKKRITIISLILSIFLLLGCNSQEKQEEVNLINENEIALNYLTIKSGIGNYIVKTSFSENETGEINKSSYDDGIHALESLNIIIENDKNISSEIKNELIEINKPLIEYCEARIKNDKTNEGYYKSIGLENEFRKKYDIE